MLHIYHVVCRVGTRLCVDIIAALDREDAKSVVCKETVESIVDMGVLSCVTPKALKAYVAEVEDEVKATLK